MRSVRNDGKVIFDIELSRLLFSVSEYRQFSHIENKLSGGSRSMGVNYPLLVDVQVTWR